MAPTVKLGARQADLVAPEDFDLLLLWQRMVYRAHYPPKSSEAPEDSPAPPPDELVYQRVLVAGLGLCARWTDGQPPNTPPFVGGLLEAYGQEVTRTLRGHGVPLHHIWQAALRAGELLQEAYYGPTEQEVATVQGFLPAEAGDPSASASSSGNASSTIHSEACG